MDMKREERLEDKAASPWAEPHALPDPKRRVVGWRNGKEIDKSDQEKLLKVEKTLRQEYLDHRKAVTAKKNISKEEAPLEDLPPTWQAFWRTVPHLDAQAAYKMFKRKQTRQEKQKEDKGDGSSMAVDAIVAPETVEEENERLDAEIKRKLADLQKQQRLESDWTKKLIRVRAEEKSEEEKFWTLNREHDRASYAHGVVQGKLRSSDVYFTFLTQDTDSTHETKVMTLKRAAAMMKGNIESMKAEVRQLFKVAAETLPPPPSAEGGSSMQRSNSASGSHRDPGVVSATEDEAGSDLNPPAVGATTGLPAP